MKSINNGKSTVGSIFMNATQIWQMGYWRSCFRIILDHTVNKEKTRLVIATTTSDTS